MILQKASVTKALYETGAFAVVRVPTVERGCEIAEGLIRGGVHAMEISYTLPNAGEVIAGIKEKFGDQMIVGAGTVMEATTARLAIMSGAQFIVANMMSDEVASICNLYQIPYAPGCTTMTEANHALSIGSAFIKCFPISNTYGSQLVGLFKTPTPWMPLMISGGINLDNLATWVKSGAECYGMGSLLTKGTADEIAANAAQVRKIIDETRASMWARGPLRPAQTAPERAATARWLLSFTVGPRVARASARVGGVFPRSLVFGAGAACAAASRRINGQRGGCIWVVGLF